MVGMEGGREMREDFVGGERVFNMVSGGCWKTSDDDQSKKLMVKDGGNIVQNKVSCHPSRFGF